MVTAISQLSPDLTRIVEGEGSFRAGMSKSNTQRANKTNWL